MQVQSPRPFFTSSLCRQHYALRLAPSSPTNTRIKASLNTCPACHGAETQTPFTQATLPFTGPPATLSQFLVGTGTVTAPSTFTMTDPVDGVTPRTYGDLVRRAADLSTLVGSSCSTNLPTAVGIAFTPILSAD